MFNSCRGLTLTLLLVFTVIGIFFNEVSSSTSFRSVDCTFEPVPMPKGPGPVSFELSFTPIYKCDEVTVSIRKLLNLQYTGEREWTEHVEAGKWNRSILNASIPANDTSGIEVIIKCGRISTIAACYFVTTGDTLEFHRGNPRGYIGVPPPPSSNTNDPFKDTLTEEQLQTEYEVILNLHNPTLLEAAERILGSIPDTSLYDSRRGYYKLNVSLENLIRLSEIPVGFEYTSSPPWDHRNHNPNVGITGSKSRHTQKGDEIDTDTLTEDQLRQEHEVILFLRDSTEREIVEQIIDSKLDSPKRFGLMRFYIKRMNLEKFIEIKRHNIDAHLLKPGLPWDRVPNDSVPDFKRRDSSEGQGVLDTEFNPNSLDGFSLEYVDGMTTPGILPTNQTIIFYINIYNPTGINMQGITNGFRIYSPDGAQWGSFAADTMNFGWRDMFDSYYSIYEYSADGIGADTAGFTGISMDTLGGLPPYFDEVAYKITIGPIDDLYDGKIICLDSSFYGLSGYWSWAYDGGYHIYYPDWDGPHCFTIESDITFSGYLYYMDPVPPDTNQMPMRSIKIEMWDDDPSPFPNELLENTVTDDNGYFILGPVENNDISGGQDVFFRIYPETEAGYVTGSYNGDSRRIQTDVLNDLPSGEYDTVIVAPLDSSGSFFVANAILEAYENWWNLPVYYVPDCVQVVLADGAGTYWVHAEHAIHIDSRDYANRAYPDTWDRDVIFHEYGHVIEYDLGFFDATGGGDNIGEFKYTWLQSHRSVTSKR